MKPSWVAGMLMRNHESERPVRFSGRSRARSLGWCAILAVLVIDARSADAVVVLESYVGSRPENATEVLAPLFAELEALGISARPAAVQAKARNGMARPGIVDPAVALAVLAERIGKATDL